ncbi:1-hydroxycarotenoid 3,4-desaturase CrtD [Rhabdaerophilum sp. SD176]|uniref:1-hydroxycarotenoid 3,4-desaturase CrtD n=1 Tax=Rhabdaerophilum sp. SD176 TaxID=2983548 RepID=UPI0024DF350B|nr:1-hydroxycarotenoid 3,4-desaturase CrtD [Rhabdaerophilum sp. SD176]
MANVTMQDQVVIIGAGIGGLSAALLLAARGFGVTVVEAAGGPGGKMRQVTVNGHPLDAGPTVFTMKAVFEQLFAEAGLDFALAVPLRRLDVLARHGWPDGSRLDLHAEREASRDAIATLAGAEAGRLYAEFAREAEAICRSLEQSFMQAERPSPFGLVRQAGIGAMLRTKPFSTMWSALGRFFPDPRLRQLFGRYATYCGSSPFRAPATLMLIAHVEQDGVWQIEGGMHVLAQALRKAIEGLGGVFRFGQRVDAIEVQNGRASGVRLANGETIPADFVISNADRAALATGLLGQEATRSVPPLPRGGRSLSAITLSGRSRFSGFPLHHHTVLFSADYPAEFAALDSGIVPADPTLYLCALDRHGAVAPEGEEGFLMLINAPARGDEAGAGLPEIETCHRLLSQALNRHGLALDPGPTPPVLTRPQDFAALFPGTGGALYGMATHGAMASFQRPGSRSRLPGLYLTGGSVHPGPGVPMVALSGRLAAEALIRDRASTRRFLSTGMPGGTAMRSALTAGSG